MSIPEPTRDRSAADPIEIAVAIDVQLYDGETIKLEKGALVDRAYVCGHTSCWQDAVTIATDSIVHIRGQVRVRTAARCLVEGTVGGLAWIATQWGGAVF